MRVLICGGRGYQNRELIFRVLDRIHERFGIHRIVHGGARGADSFAEAWAAAHYTDSAEYAADWETYGVGAGPRRNERMLRDGKPDLVVAFPGGRGTADMVRRAKLAKVDVIEVDKWGETTWYTKRIAPR